LVERIFIQRYRSWIRKWITGNLKQYPVAASGISQY